MSKETVDRTDEIATILQDYEYNNQPVAVIDIDAWVTADIVRIINLLDAELQRRGRHAQDIAGLMV